MCNSYVKLLTGNQPWQWNMSHSVPVGLSDEMAQNLFKDFPAMIDDINDYRNPDGIPLNTSNYHYLALYTFC